jgi:hypothetical protein
MTFLGFCWKVPRTERSPAPGPIENSLQSGGLRFAMSQKRNLIEAENRLEKSAAVRSKTGRLWIDLDSTVECMPSTARRWPATNQFEGPQSLCEPAAPGAWA